MSANISYLDIPYQTSIVRTFHFPPPITYYNKKCSDDHLTQKSQHKSTFQVMFSRFPEIALLGSPLLTSALKAFCGFNILKVFWLTAENI